MVIEEIIYGKNFVGLLNFNLNFVHWCGELTFFPFHILFWLGTLLPFKNGHDETVTEQIIAEIIMLRC
jgi:hypothetical protein